jgi:hypothetical protein
MKFFLISISIFTIFSFAPADMLIGRWETKPSPKGNVTGILFRDNNTFEGYINKKPFVSGSYEVKDSVLSFVDNGCDGKRAIYNIIFFSNNDSLRFSVISDPCEERRKGMSVTVFGRKK